MITITLYNKAITCSGHAEFAQSGTDIYCAGVSAVIMSAMNWFKPRDLEYQVEDGFLQMKLVNLSESNLYKLNLLKQQLKAFTQEDFEPYIKVKESGKDYYE